MKKIVITLVVLGLAFGVKAQQLPLLPKQQPLQQFGLMPDSLSAYNFSVQPNSQLKNAAVKANILDNTNIENMPIARMQGNWNMPVVQTDRTGYNMPVVGKRMPEVYMMKKPGAELEVLPLNNKDKQ